MQLLSLTFTDQRFKHSLAWFPAQDLTRLQWRCQPEYLVNLRPKRGRIWFQAQSGYWQLVIDVWPRTLGFTCSWPEAAHSSQGFSNMTVYFIKPINWISLLLQSAKTESYIIQCNYRGDMLSPLPYYVT